MTPKWGTNSGLSRDWLASPRSHKSLKGGSDITSMCMPRQGIPTFCSLGDDGARDRNPRDGIANVDYPASSPFAFGCGGVRITLNDIVTEIA